MHTQRNHKPSCGEFSLSSTQQVIWLDQMTRPNSSDYNLSILILLEGELDELLFIQALEAVVSHHDALRLKLIETYGMPRQTFVETLPLPLTVYDFSQETDAEFRAEQQMHANFIRPFCLYNELWHTGLFRVGENRWYWQFCCHHLILDGMGLKLIFKELLEHYRHLATGENLPDIAPSYLDFITEDQAYLNSKLYMRDLQFWQKRYETLPSALLPLPHSRTPATSEFAKPVFWQLDKTLSQQIENIAAAHGLSVLHFMYAILACYFTRINGTEEIVIGIPVHNRKNKKQKSTLGMFSSIIPIRVTIHADDSVLDIMHKVATELHHCYKHQRFPITEINQHTQIKQKTGRSQLFDIALSFEPFNVCVSMENIAMTLKGSYRGVMFPLSIAIHQYSISTPHQIEKENKPFTIEFSYDSNYLSYEEVITLQSRLALLIEAAVISLDTKVKHVPLLPETERHNLLFTFNNTEAEFPQDALIHELFEQQAALTPDATAVVFEEQSLSYNELNRRANRLAHYLIALGVQPDDRVALCVERSPEMIVGLLGILKAGAAYVPLDPRYPTDRLRYMLHEAAPVALFTQSELVARLENDLPTVLLDTPALSAFDDMPDTNPDCRTRGLNSHHLAYVIYTSGSTGNPKGIMVTHCNVINLCTGLQSVINLTTPGRTALNASIVFDASVQSWLQLLAGHTLVIIPEAIRANGTQLWRYLAHHEVDLFDCTPVQLQWLLNAGLGTDVGYQPQQVLIGGEAISPVVWSRLQQIETPRFINVYGPTECTVDATFCSVDHSLPYPSIGHPIANTRIYILDAYGQPVPLSVTGEIYIGGAGVARGYLNQPELTAERFVVDPFSSQPDTRMYKTGDLGRWLPDGNIEYLGRNDFQIKLRGFRIEPGEIEAHLMQCQGVKDAIVIVREDTEGDTRLVAYLCAETGTELVPVDLHRQLAHHLAEYMLPCAFVILDTFPLTPNGKLDRKALPAPDLSAVITHDYAAPIGDVETALVEIWQDLLGVDRVGRHDHFFKLGGHSLIAVNLIEQLRNRGYSLDVSAVFATPLLTEMAQAIQTGMDVPRVPDLVPPNRIPEGCTVITPEMLPLVTLSQSEIDTVIATVTGGVANVQDTYPLSPLQAGILFHYQLQENDDTYLLNTLLAFDTQARLEAFLAALQQVIDRHDILRTAFCWQGLSQPVQVVWRQAPLLVTSFIPTSVQNIPSQLQAHIAQRMNISQAPLFTASTAHDPASNEWLLGLSFHHLVSDHVTLELIMDEIQQLLQGEVESLPAPLPYRNFIAQMLNIPPSVHEDYFRERLAEIDESTAPFGLLNVQGDVTDVTEAQLCLDITLVQTLRALARQLGISPSVLFHVAWAQVLAHTSGRDDVVFGTVLSGRLQGTTGADQVMGMFINTLPVRISLSNQTVLEVVRATAKDLADLLEHEQFPLALAQRCSGVTPPQPLFSALLNYRHTSSHGSSDSTENPRWEGVRLLSSKEWTNYPLDLSVDDFGDDFALVVQAVNSVDPRRVVNYLYTALCGLTEALQNNPSQPVWALSILPVAERQQLLEVFNATQTDFLPSNALIHTLFEHRVQQAPEAIAIISEPRSLSYGELNQRANQLAHALIAAGIRPDDRVALCIERSPDMIIGILGILKAGAAYVPLDPNYPDKRRAYVLSDSTPKLLLTQQHLQAQAQNHDIPVWFLDEADYLERVAQYSVTNPEPEQLGLQRHHLAYVIYTSGSTGLPKGVMVEHRNVVNFIHAQCQITALNATDRVLQFATIAFDASVAEIFPTLATGATLVLRPNHLQIPDAAFSHFLQEQAISVVDIPTAFWHQWGQEIKAGRSGFSSTLRSITVGGEKTNLHSLVDWQSLPETQHCRWTDTYGPTEATVIVTSLSLNGGTLLDAAETLSIGRPIANCRIYLLDKTQQLVPLGVTGEIYIGGEGVARGYLNCSDLTAERFVADPFSSQPDARMYKTGDLGRWLPDGNIEYLGRNDFQVKIRGFRIEPGEIEAQLVACQGVREAVVIAHKTDKDEQRLVAYLVPQPDVTLEAADLREQLKSCLADYMLPNAFVMLDIFPLTPNGKLDRKALPAPDLSTVITRNYEAPVGEVETALTEIWQELLGLERVGRHDHFFELGGHSLIAVSLIEQLRRRGYSLEVRSIFATPLLSEMAQAIHAQQDTSDIFVPANRIPDGCTHITPDMLPLVTLSQTEINTIVATVAGGVANVQDIYPLSPLQEGLLFHHQLQEDGDAYLSNSLLAFDTRSRLDTFLNALQQVIDRHDILRTAFCWQGLCKPMQVVWREAKLSVMSFIPISAENIPSQLQANITNRLDITQAPLFTASTVYDPASEEWLLALSFHHLVCDNMTLTLIMDEIQQLLQKQTVQGQAIELTPPLLYHNFIAQTLNVPDSVHEDYFRQQLADIDEPTAPFGLLNVQGNGTDVTESRLSLDKTLAHTLRAQARRLGISASVLFHVACAQVLAKICGQEKVVFGTVLLGRLHGSADADQMMGMLINTLPIRVSLSNFSVLEVVQATAKNLANLLEHEQAPLALAQNCSGVIPPMPLFSVLFNYRHGSSIPAEAEKRVWKGIRLLASVERTNYPITLSVDDTEDGFTLVAQSVAGAEPCRLVNYLHTALSELVNTLMTEPQRPALDLSILPAAERQLLLENFNATQADFPQDTLIHELFEQQVDRTPEAIAVVWEGKTLSYSELNRQANQLAHYLIELGVKPDDRVAICVERSLDMIVGILAILKAGGAYVPLDPAYPADRLTYMLADADPVVLLLQTTLSEIFEELALPIVRLDDQLLPTLANQPETNPVAAAQGLTPCHMAYVIYTSGSTGQPKGVMVEHTNVTRLLAATQSRFRFDNNDIWTLFHSFAFDFSVWELWGALAYGGRLVVISTECARSPQMFYELLCREQVTVLNQTPSAFRQLIVAQNAMPHAQHTLRCIIFGGEALELHTLAPWVDRNPTEQTRLVNMYGITEITVHATYRELTEPDVYSGKGSLIGQPLDDLRIYVLDVYGQPAPLGVAGELYVAGAGVARGYLNRPELTSERFLPDVFSDKPGMRMYKTGDLARWLPDGNLEYLGRNDFQVKLRGFRIELGEIEAGLMQCPGVQEAVVIAREDAEGNTRLVAYLCAEAGTELVPVDLRRQLAQHLAEYMIPSAFVMLDSFPLTPNGKLDRKALPAPDLYAVITRDYEAPIGDVEIALSEIWQELLGLERVGRHDHFFELGGHSLIAVSLIEQLRSRGYLLEVRSIFATPLLSEMAQAIQARQGAPDMLVPPNRIPDGCTRITPDMLPLVTLSHTEIDSIVATVAGGVANVQDIYPLSPLQEGILFHHQLQEDVDTYLLNTLLAFDTRSRLDTFLNALQQVIDRHDILRTAFCWHGLSQPVQVVWRQAKLPVTSFVLAQQQPPQSISRLDITQAPLFAASIALDSDSNEWLLTLNFHHLVSDHMTLEFIMKEIFLLLDGQEESLPAPLPYRNFIAQILKIPNSVHESYFRERFADIDEPTAPFGLLNIQGSGANLVEARLRLNDTLAQTLRAQSRRLGVSPSVLFHIAFAQVLAHISDREEVVFGTVLLGRLHGSAGADRVMGMFINTLPIRISLNNLNVWEVVQATATNLAELLEHEQAPLALAQRCSRVPPPLPLFSALFNYRYSPSALVEKSGWEGVRLLAAEERTNYPLDLSVDDSGDGFTLIAQTANTVDPERIVNYLHTALLGLTEALQTHSQRLVRELPILSDAERQQLLEDFNTTQTDFPSTAFIHTLFEQQAQYKPNAIAVITENSSLSYGELNQRANQLAYALIAVGIQPDDRIALCVERSPDMIIGILGILKAGAGYVPLDPSHPDKRRAYVLSDCAPRLLLTQQHLQEHVSNSDTPIWLLDEADYLERVAQYPVINPEPEQLRLQSHHLAYVIYTSGSTGLPKGVMVEHRNVVNFIHAQCQISGLNTTDRVLQFATIAFDASVEEIFPTLATGATLILRPPHLQIPDAAFSHFLKEQAVSIAELPTAFWHQWGQEIKAGRSEFSPTLRSVIIGGEKADRHYLSDWLSLPETGHCCLIDTYGPTETTVIATSMKLNGSIWPDATEKLSIGRPIANTRIYILDKQKQPVPFGVRGEIYIGGVGVARGYLNRPDLTAERFVVDPFSPEPEARMYKTGDLGRWLPGGNIEYLGRNDFQVKIRGFRIEPEEIGAQLLACDGVKEAIVIAHEADNGEKRLIAYLVAQPDVMLETANLREELKLCLPNYMLPSAFVMLDSLPLTPNGKLDRKALPAPDLSAVITRDYVEPVGDVENRLAQIWQELLSLERVGRHDSFFEIGGHSLLAARLIARIQTEFLVQIPIISIFQSSRLSELSELILSAQMSSVWGDDSELIKKNLDAMSAEELIAILSGDTEE
ncbi:non-ribosomal peptide synthetase [Xenorhabdus sp. KJ12.1]|uniref:non-ribosomal peptide synthetase n=1 Tax=Xenorhabdus sp. KJ12.1 TaxID=1851571 RepID=UPI000C064363|nr:non-ribosomal peptide synthetase [Xenorhabdus sp. KJ12.1]PHM69613.1 Amino acid adenylation [Xenorhabdus sp. KJ12.1]